MTNNNNDKGRDNRPAESPVSADLTAQMAIDIAVNQQSQVWVFHNKPFPGELEWVEYDTGEKRLVFVTEGGTISDFGMKIEPALGQYLEKAEFVETYLMWNSAVLNFARVPLLVRKTVH